MNLNHWSKIRRLAREVRKEMLTASGGDLSPDALLSAIAKNTGILRIGVEAGDPLLYKAQAILHNNMVFFDNSFDEWRAHFNQMHEYAHHFLNHGSATLCYSDDFDPEASEDAIAFGEQRVEGYGPHERRELEANLFAREFFLPCDELKDNFLAGENDNSIALKFQMPTGMVTHQLMRAVLGIETVLPDENVNEKYLDEFDLDSDQKNAARFGEEEFLSGDFEPPVLVDAGPGTGKTRTLTARVVHLIDERKIPPENILALTYSNKAAEEMYTRVSMAVSQNSSHIWMGTFHKFCLELIRKYHYLLDVSAKPLVADTYDVEILLEQSLNRLNLKFYRSLTRPSSNFQRILKAIARAKDELVSPEKYENHAQTDLDNSAKNKRKRERAEKDLEIANAYRVYQEVLGENNLLDYGDLLLLAVKLLRAHEHVREEIQQKYRYILIDEYQDVNTASRELLKLIAGDGNGLWVVGDIRQAIYRFRGAAPTNMLLLVDQDYPAAKVLQLKTNYRARQKIVNTFTNCSNRMRAQVDDSRITEWRINRSDDEGEVNFIEAADEFDEAWEIVERVQNLQKQKLDYRNQVILCRNHDDLVHYSSALEEAGIPVLYLGNFFERPEIRDLLCVIDFASGMDGRSLYRLSGFKEYDFSFDDAGKLISYALENNKRFPGALSSLNDLESLSDGGKISLEIVTEHFEDCHPNNSAWTVLSRYLFSKSNYLRNLVADNAPQAIQRRLAIYQLLLLTYQLREKFTEPKRDKKKLFLNYVRHLKLNNEERIIRQTPHWADAINAVKMLTVHAAKGLEFKVVHLPALSEGKFSVREWKGNKVVLPSGILRPEMSDWETEEEQCLFFVALSRACDILNIYRAEQYQNVTVLRSDLLNLLEGVLPVPQRAKTKPKHPQVQRDKFTDRKIESDFDEKVLQDYLDCPLKYQYRYELRIPYLYPESPINKARLCVAKVWSEINQQANKQILIDQTLIDKVFDEVWEKHGPKEHPYAPDYRQEALNMVNWTLKSHPHNVDALTKPLWYVEIENARIALYPDYIKEIKESGRHTLIVEKLNFGEFPRKQIKELIYTLYEEAALQNRVNAKVRTEIKASFMTDQITLPVPISAQNKELGMQNYKAAVDGINNGIFYANESKSCPMCPYYFICLAKHR